MKKMIINSYTKTSFFSSLFCPVSVLEPKIYLNNKNIHKDNKNQIKHKCYFIFTLVGCDERSSKNIEVECFNRSYAGQHGQ
jgi:hypothetical protein